MSLYKHQRGQVKNRILETAISIFRDKGYESTTIDEITKAVGIAKGTLYNFYSSKSEILLTWTMQKFSQLDIKEALNKENTLEQNLEKFIDILAGEIEAETRLFRDFLIEIIKNDWSAQGEQFDFFSIYRLIIMHSKDHNTVVDSLFEEKLAVLNSSLFMGIINWLDSNDSAEGLKEHLIRISKVCLYGLFRKDAYLD